MWSAAVAGWSRGDCTLDAEAVPNGLSVSFGNMWVCANLWFARVGVPTIATVSTGYRLGLGGCPMPNPEPPLPWRGSRQKLDEGVSLLNEAGHALVMDGYRLVGSGDWKKDSNSAGKSPYPAMVNEDSVRCLAETGSARSSNAEKLRDEKACFFGWTALSPSSRSATMNEGSACLFGGEGIACMLGGCVLWRLLTSPVNHSWLLRLMGWLLNE